MIAYFEQFVNRLKRPKILLILANIMLVFFLILLSNLGVLPVKGVGDFVFFTILAFVFALYRPGWAFLFFVGTIALENINLAPVEIGINIRPYQFIGGLAVVAIIIRSAFKRLNFTLPKWNWADGLLILFVISGFISAIFQGSTFTGSKVEPLLSLKQAVIVATFAALYFLVRIFIQNLEDLKRLVPFFLGSAVVVIIYGIWQNIRFAKGLSHFEVMPGRPNATFTEPDWLGIYLVVVLAILYSLIFYFVIARERSDRGNPVPINSRLLRFARNDINLYLLIISCFILLILTVSRSAWLGAAAVGIMYQLSCIKYYIFSSNRNWKGFFQQLLFIAMAIIGSFVVVYVFNLTNFQLFNRAQSTGTGLQKITIACFPRAKLLENQELSSWVYAVEDLEKLGCRHIDLDKIDIEKAAGNVVHEVYRQDPNVNIRKEIYQKSWSEIKKHPVLGIGWGNINNILGKDERGAGLNSSNIFLEAWLGAGLLGITTLVVFLLTGFAHALKLVMSNKNPPRQILGLFLLLGFVALIIPNLFNAGIFLGIFWLFLGIFNLESVIDYF